MEVSTELVQAIRKQLRGTESPREIEQLLLAAGLSPELVAAVLPHLAPAGPPPLPADTAPLPQRAPPPPAAVAPPRLMVDWGEHPEVGHQARPHFMLLCPEPYGSQPDVKINVDRELDSELGDGPQVYFEDERLWGFHVPFRLTTRGADCRPGQYLLDVRVAFPDLTIPGVPRCFRCAVRLKIQAPGSGRTLEIDGDGQAAINLYGHDLTGFSRVVLKASGDGAINLQNVDSPRSTIQAAPAAARESAVHEYSLKVDQDRERLLPRLSTTFTRREQMESAMLVFSNRKRVILVPRRQVKIGRNRDNDIVLRFLPRNETHDRWSKALSRTHFVLELAEQGIRLQDTSSTGTKAAAKAVSGEVLFGPERVGQALLIELGTSAEVERTMELEAQLLRSDERTGPPGASDELVARTVGEPVPALWRLAKSARIDAVRLKRRGNLTEEEYLLLFREAQLRPSRDAPVVSVGGTLFEAASARVRHVGGVFWLENVGGQSPVLINDQAIPPRELVPLAAGMVLTLGRERILFNRTEQIGLES